MPQALMAAAIAACLPLVGCESPGGKVSVLSGQAPLAGSTYAWAPDGQPGSGDPRVDNDIIRERIKTAIDTNLAAKGYSQVAPGQAKLLVAYHIGLQNKTDYSATSMGAPGGGVACGRRGCIGGYGWGMYGAPMDVDVRSINYTEGAVMLDLVDAASGKLAWRATSQKRVDEKDATQDGLNAIVADMVKTLPPGAAPAG
ncbi:DUF4136 domain-containing protein [Caulobacter soli]|uniref:DUF4136 domain-containing protein n=1 Tax=Caulobacter soli TaxID=2708539 RepID=UPI0013EBB716|nr:DUF4136 domain-containing protein [Caulobacter soli]